MRGGCVHVLGQVHGWRRFQTNAPVCWMFSTCLPVWRRSEDRRHVKDGREGSFRAEVDVSPWLSREEIQTIGRGAMMALKRIRALGRGPWRARRSKGFVGHARVFPDPG